MIKLKRAYDTASPDDGMRILVDRVWPRGLSKERLRADLWLKEVGPSTSLRKWFSHDPDKWPEFEKRYARELADNPAFEQLRQLIKKRAVVTFVFGSANKQYNQAVALKELLKKP